MKIPEQGEKMIFGDKEAIMNNFTPEEMFTIYMSLHVFKDESDEMLECRCISPIYLKEIINHANSALSKINKTFTVLGIDVENYK